MGKKGAALLLAALLLTGCGSTPADTDQHFALGDTVSTAWFDYTVTGVEAVDAYGGYISAQGAHLVVVELTLESTYTQPVTMFDTDFQLSWEGMDPEDTRCMPVEYYCEQQLPTQYELDSKEERSGVLVYQVPQEEQEFQLAFQELFDDGTQEGRLGELYIVDLAP